MSVTSIPPVPETGDSQPTPRRNVLRTYVQPAIVITLLFTIVTGLIYPGVVTLLGQLIFPYQANGSLVTVNGKVIGSDNIGLRRSTFMGVHRRPPIQVPERHPHTRPITRLPRI